jgi:hypothetical protein
VERLRVGRRNTYTVNRDRMMRHRAQVDHDIGELIDLLEPDHPVEAQALSRSESALPDERAGEQMH